MRYESAVRIRVLVVAGKCPAILKSSSYEDIEEWVAAIERTKSPNEEYQVSVYRYWARRQHFDEPLLLAKILKNLALVMNSNDTICSLAEKEPNEKK